AGADRIVARGLRNPFRFTIRPGTNELWIGDVGWVDYEEIDRLTNPKGPVPNFGGPRYEGGPKQDVWQGVGSGVCDALYAQPGAVTAPYYQYHRDEKVVAGGACPPGGASVSGLAVYRGGTHPARE